MNKSSLFLLSFLLLSKISFSQPNVGFNQLTGTANVNIPLYNIGGAPIGLSYQANGIKVKDVSGIVGLGWGLNAGGAISREVRGLADDTPGIGLFYNGAATLISGLGECTIDDCTLSSDDKDNLTTLYGLGDTEPDVFYINTPFLSGKFIFDTSTGQAVSQTQSFQNLFINYTTDSDGRIVSFELTDDSGIVYDFSLVTKSQSKVYFSENDFTFKKIRDDYGSYQVVNDQWLITNISFPNGNFIRFDYELIFEKNALISQTSYSFRFDKSYQSGLLGNYTYSGAASGTYSMSYDALNHYLLSSVSSSSGDKVEFQYKNQNDKISENLLYQIDRYKNQQLLSSYVLNYDDIYSEHLQTYEPSEDDLEYEKRVFLKSINPKFGINVYEGYIFDYYGVYDYYAQLPSVSTSKTDVFGYYKQNSEAGTYPTYFYNTAPELNIEGIEYYQEELPESSEYKDTEVKLVRDLKPTIYYYPGLDPNYGQYRVDPLPSTHVAKSSEIVITGADRSVDPGGLHIGSLSKLTYPSGGNVRLFYEANKYYDNHANGHYYGPGVRLQKTILHDGVSNKNNVTTYYDYNFASGLSSGVVLNRPVYAFGVSHNSGSFEDPEMTYDYIINNYSIEAQARLLSLHTNFNVGQNNLGVYYQQVGVSQTGKGKTTYNYSIKGKLDDLSSNEGEWSPTYIGTDAGISESPHTLIELGRFTPGTRVYPFSFDTNYDFERGLLEKVSSYNELDQLVTETKYEYIRTNPTGYINEIVGLSIDKLQAYPKGTLDETVPKQSFIVFGKYKLFTNYRNSVSKVINKTYDPSDLSKSLNSETNYTYDATDKRLSKVWKESSDGTVYSSHIKYVADYDVTSPSGLEAQMLNKLQSSHQLGLHVEKYSTVTNPGSSEKLISASLTTFNDFNKLTVNPYKSFVMENLYSIDFLSFAPSHISNGSFQKDSRYKLTRSVKGYDALNMPATVVAEVGKLSSGTHWGYTTRMPIASISNGNADHFIYSGFDEETGYDFNYNDGNLNEPEYQNFDSKALLLKNESGVFLERNLPKSSSTKKIKLSYKIKTQADAGNLVIQFHDKITDSFIMSKSFGYAISEDFIVYEQIIDVSTLPNTFKVKLRSTSNVFIDDIVLYPESSTVVYKNYNSIGLLNYESVAGGTTTYLEYDDLNRNTMVRDDDRNIISKNEYFDNIIEAPLSFNFKYLGSSTNDEAVFELIDGRIFTEGYTVTVAFGDGIPAITIDGISFSHNYFSNGVYTVTLKAVKSGMPDEVTKQTITVGDLGPKAMVCVMGPKIYDVCNDYAHKVFPGTCLSSTGTELVPTRFVFEEIDNCPECIETNFTYSWQLKKESQSVFSEVSTEQSYSAPVSEESYSVKLIVNTNSPDNLIITSDIYDVFVTKSDPGCTTALH